MSTPIRVLSTIKEWKDLAIAISEDGYEVEFDTVSLDEPQIKDRIQTRVFHEYSIDDDGDYVLLGGDYIPKEVVVPAYKFKIKGKINETSKI